jgi:hypothetical protein
MWAAPGLYSPHALGRQSAHANQELGIFASIDIVGYGSDTQPAVLGIAEPPAESIHQGRLATAYRAGNADSKGTLRVKVGHNFRKENIFG